ncbi:type IV secretory system conjugative DNA transfer family protein [Streptomyces ficellus]|uniref:Type IV secretory system conjugative DNA transfer family protein n=1 Tax=Streptomyces ficellus TaxID=1977088 RepID=A0ABT7ZCX4_9ACTN|nr:type IV secretory system conjugative DNA transfer family protein [Streptomyces ficellus]MDN3297362.1 type IV secretory system conjugative DNA transfer family protein [Streptomyces ficellus]
MRGQHDAERGIPDGLLVGLLGFLLGVTLLVWTATGLAGLFANGAWPEGVTFTHTPAAIRSLVSQPQDLAGAWPATPAGQLSGYGLFWGLLMGELMVLVVLAVFVLGTVARWRAVRAARAAGVAGVAGAARVKASAGTATIPAQPETVRHTPVTTPAAEPPAPALPRPTSPAPSEPPAPTPRTQAPHPAAPTPRIVYGTPSTRRPATLRAIQEADGPALVVTSDPAVWAETKDARAKLGPVLVYDPGHLCDTPARLHWSPTHGCENIDTAATRAAALLAPVRPRARMDAAVADTAETLLRCWLHAAAVEGRPVKQVQRWAQNNGAHEPVRILRTHPKATNSHAGLLESALTAYPDRREAAQELTVRALASLSSVHIREACTPNRTDSLALESFIAEAGTLYVVGEPIEDPRTHPGAMPLLTALASDVVEHGRRMAARSSDGRLDPPMTLVLDDLAAVAPLPALPELLATGREQGLPTLVLLRSPEQGRARWPDQPLTP